MALFTGRFAGGNEWLWTSCHNAWDKSPVFLSRWHFVQSGERKFRDKLSCRKNVPARSARRTVRAWGQNGPLHRQNNSCARSHTNAPSTLLSLVRFKTKVFGAIGRPPYVADLLTDQEHASPWLFQTRRNYFRGLSIRHGWGVPHSLSIERAYVFAIPAHNYSILYISLRPPSVQVYYVGRVNCASPSPCTSPSPCETILLIHS